MCLGECNIPFLFSKFAFWVWAGGGGNSKKAHSLQIFHVVRASEAACMNPNPSTLGRAPLKSWPRARPSREAASRRSDTPLQRVKPQPLLRTPPFCPRRARKAPESPRQAPRTTKKLQKASKAPLKEGDPWLCPFPQ